MLHNIALNLASEKEGIGAKTLTSTMDKETAKKAGSVFDGSSNTKLEKQLNEVVGYAAGRIPCSADEAG